MTAEAAGPAVVDPPPVVLAVRGIRKSFSGVEVLHGVDFTLRRGEVHGIVGQNGAGKSTLVKIIDGAYTGDSGEIEIDGIPLTRRAPGESRRRGIAMVFQEFSLIPSMPVGHNVVLTREPTGRTGLIDDREVRRRAGRRWPASGPTSTRTAWSKTCRSGPASSWRSPRPSRRTPAS